MNVFIYRPLLAAGVGIGATTLLGVLLGGIAWLFEERSGSFLLWPMIPAFFFMGSFLGGGLALALSLFFKPGRIAAKGAACGTILPGLILLIVAAKSESLAPIAFMACLFLVPGALSGAIAAHVMHRGAHGAA